MNVRPATPADAPVLAELRWAFRTAHYRSDTPVESHDVFVARCTAWFATELAGDDWRAWVAVRDGRLVGQIWAGTIRKLPNPVVEPESHLYVSNLFVEPDARGGVGTQLLEAVLEWARGQAFDRVILWPSPRSVSLYTRHGFVRTGGSLMELSLADTSRPAEPLG